MNRKHLIAAAAALVATSAAQALTPTEITDRRTAGTLNEFRIAGASALRLSVAAYMKEICAPATFHVYHATSSSDHRAYACELAATVGSLPAGSSVLVYKRDAGGSGQGVNPIARAQAQTHMTVDGTCVAEGLGATPATDANVANYRCGGTASVVSDAGISDVEPALLQASVNLTQATPAGYTPAAAAGSALTSAELSNLNSGALVQALFGVAVNKKAYRALQEAQGIIGAGAAMIDVPADQTTWTAATLDTIPSLPTSFVASYLSGNLAAGTAARGWNMVIPTTVDASAASRTINICRRTEGSGTQAVSNAYFLNNGCSKASGDLLNPVGVGHSVGNDSNIVQGGVTVVTGVTPRALNGVVVEEGTSAGQVEDCVGNEAQNAAGDAYALAVLGREANPLRSGGDMGYRFVKLDGVAPVRSEAQVGRYPMVFEATMQWNKSVVAAGSAREQFLAALRTGFGKASALAAVDADTQQGVMAPPATYSGSFPSQTDPNVLAFGSRVSRVSANSCAPLRLVK